MKVVLISHTPNPERLVASAARLCYSPSSIEDTAKSLSDEKIQSFVKMLAGIGHESPLEHISFTFGIEGVSRAFLAQITRHRIASYSVQSQRYVKEDMFEFVVPPAVEGVAEAKQEFLKAMQKDQEHYNKICDVLMCKYKKEFIERGIEEKSAEKMAEKKAIEDARFVLPNACETKMICTFNARSLLNFFKHRCCNRAQWEIREVATEMLRLCKGVAPNIFSKAGPSCLRGACSEGKMSCGEFQQVRKKFSELEGKNNEG